MLFLFSEFIINRKKKNFILNLWFIMGFKTCRKQSMELHQRKACCNKAWDLVLKPCAQFMSHFFLWYISIRFTWMYIMYFNFQYFHQCRYTHYFYVCIWNKIKKTKTIDAINKTFLQITQVMELSQALETVPEKNDYLFGYQCNLLYFLK